MKFTSTVFKTEQVGYILKYISTKNLVAVGVTKAAEVIVTMLPCIMIRARVGWAGCAVRSISN